VHYFRFVCALLLTDAYFKISSHLCWREKLQVFCQILSVVTTLLHKLRLQNVFILQTSCTAYNSLKTTEAVSTMKFVLLYVFSTVWNNDLLRRLSRLCSNRLKQNIGLWAAVTKTEQHNTKNYEALFKNYFTYNTTAIIGFAQHLTNSIKAWKLKTCIHSWNTYRLQYISNTANFMYYSCIHLTRLKRRLH